jgi:gamma-glutamyltranspeptidase/glutathione hydrolase
MAVPEELARNLALADASRTGQPGFAGLFMPGGRRLAAGEPLRQAALAEVLKAIAQDGERGFYEGFAAQSLVRFSQDNGGLFAPEDFARAQADWVPAWSARLGAAQVHVMPPNSVGVLMLQQLEHWHRAQRPGGAAGIAAAIDTAIAVIADGRERIGDIERTPCVPGDFGVTGSVDAQGAMASFRSARAGVGDTTGFVAMDAEGNALALLQSVFQPFGSGAVDGRTGVLLNNRMFDFSPVRGGVNAVGPGMRSSHTLNPWLVLDETGARMAGVSPGGVSQTTTGFQVVSGALQGEATLGQLVAQPRWSLARDGEVLLEPGMTEGVAEALRARGHAVQENSSHDFYFGSVKAVRRTDAGSIEAAADNRRQATALAW